MDIIIVNEVLSYVKHHHGSSTIDHIKQVVKGFYDEQEIIKAKQDIYEKCNDVVGVYPVRHNSPLRSALVMHVDDIFEAIRILDAENKMPDILARNLDRLPSNNPEELNPLYMLNRIAGLEKVSALHAKTLESNTKDITELKDYKNEYMATANGNGPIANNRVHIINNDTENVGTINNANGVREVPTPVTITTTTAADDADNSTNAENEENYINENPNNIIADERVEVVNPRNESRGYNVALRTPPTRQQLPNLSPRQPRLNNISQGRDRRDSEINNDDGFIPVLSRNERRRRRASNNGFRGAPIPTRNLWISRVANGESNDIKQYMVDKGVTAHEIVKVSHEEATFKSYKITISVKDIKHALHNNFWPEGVNCKFWKEKARVNEPVNNNDSDDDSLSMHSVRDNWEDY